MLSCFVRAGVINATGCFGDAVRLMDDPTAIPLIVGAAGTHIILPDHFSPDKCVARAACAAADLSGRGRGQIGVRAFPRTQPLPYISAAEAPAVALVRSLLYPSFLCLCLRFPFASRSMGLIIPKTRDGRVLFFLPWEGMTICGTTDSPSDITMAPAPTEQDVRFIIEESNRYLARKVGAAGGCWRGEAGVSTRVQRSWGCAGLGACCAAVIASSEAGCSVVCPQL